MILDHFQANLIQLLIDFYTKLVVLPCILQESESIYCIYALFSASNEKET